MGIYNFQERFVSAIVTGRKRQTIRARRKHPDKVGSILHLYTGLRHPGAELLGRYPCTWTAGILIPEDGMIVVDGVELTHTECDQLAQRDGFDGYAEMIAFWMGRLPFEGQIIGWGASQAEMDRADPRTHLKRDAKLEADRLDPS